MGVWWPPEFGINDVGGKGSGGPQPGLSPSVSCLTRQFSARADGKNPGDEADGLNCLSARHGIPQHDEYEAAQPGPCCRVSALVTGSAKAGRLQ